MKTLMFVKRAAHRMLGKSRGYGLISRITSTRSF